MTNRYKRSKKENLILERQELPKDKKVGIQAKVQGECTNLP